MRAPTFDEMYEVGKRLRPQVEKQLAEGRLMPIAEFPSSNQVTPTDYGRRPCPFSLNNAHDFEAHTTSDVIIQLHCRACGLILPDQIEPDGTYREAIGTSRVVHIYKGEGLTTCGLEVVGPCPDCERAT